MSPIATIAVLLGGQPHEFKVSNEPPPDYDDAAPPTASTDSDVLQTIGDLRRVIGEVSNFDGNSMKLIYKGLLITMLKVFIYTYYW